MYACTSESGAAPTGVVLLLHGWSQSLSCWRHQAEGALTRACRVVAPDLRGHGMSDHRVDPATYQQPELWAADVAAVIDQLRLHRPVLVGWSYAGFVICDYLRIHGERQIGGVNLAGGAVLLGPDYAHIGPAFLDNAPVACGPDLPTGIAALRRLVRAFTVEPMSNEDREALLCAAMTVSPQVRGALLRRRINGDEVLANLTVPVLVSHGRCDTVVLPSMAEHVLAVCPTAQASWYDNTAHMPFVEDPERFDHELRDLTRRVSGLTA